MKNVIKTNNATAPEKDIIDELSSEQLKELDKAIKEADNNETTSWDDFKKKMASWKESL